MWSPWLLAHPLHGAALLLLLPGMLLFTGLQRALPCCWLQPISCREVPGSRHAATRTSSAAVCLLNFPVLHQTAAEAGGNLPHPHQDCAVLGGYTTAQGSGCACPQTKLMASVFPGVSFQVLSFSSVLGASIASWDELGLLFNKCPVVVGTRAGATLSFFSVLPTEHYQALGLLRQV